jgi:hypothetical protein
VDLKSSALVNPIMDDICAWLRANHVEPSIVPTWAVPKLEGGRLTCTVFALRDGKKYLLEDRETIALDFLDVPLTQEPPAVLAEWLASEEG